MKRYKLLAVRTPYWRPGKDLAEGIIEALRDRIRNGDIVVISEKAISTATGNVVDESMTKPNFTADFLARYWMRYVWGYFLGLVCRLRKRTISHLRNYPLKEGGAHKQVVLAHCGLLEALAHGSEGGIDGSNLPYSYVSLPLASARQSAETINTTIRHRLRVNAVVMIADTDKTYSWRNFHFSPRSKPTSGIHSVPRFAAYTLGRLFRLKKRATPLAVAGGETHAERALHLAELANRARGSGAGRTIYDMAKNFEVSITAVSWEMLDKVRHYPIVIIRPP